MDLYKKSKLKYLDMVLQKSILKAFYSWKFFFPHNSPRIVSKTSLKNRLFSSSESVISSILPHCKAKKSTQKSSLFEELKASLNTKAQNMNYRKSGHHNTGKVLISTTTPPLKLSQRHQRANTYSSTDLAVISLNTE